MDGADTFIVAYRSQGELTFEPQRSSVFPKVSVPSTKLPPHAEPYVISR